MRRAKRRWYARRQVLEFLEERSVPAVYWVATAGDDSQPGSNAAPWRTLQHAADQVAAGDTVHVLAGAYQGFDLRTSGTAENPIQFLADDGVVVDEDNPITIDGINLEGADYVVIDGFEVTGATRAGIRSVLNQHVTLTNNHTHHNGRWGIFTGFSDDLLIEGNTTTYSAIEHGIYVSNSADRPVIRNNLIYGNRANGIHLNGDASLGGDGVVSEALIEGNVIYDNGTGGGSGINGDGLIDSIIRNNLIYNTHASGISLYRIDGGQGATGNLVANNTVIVAADGRWAINIQNGSTGNTLLNNVFYTHHSYRGSISISPDSIAGTVSDYNVVESRFTTDDGDSVMSLSQWQSSTGLDTHSVVSSPTELFVSPASGDYHLRPGSPAIDIGTAVSGVTVDIDGEPRPMGAGYDIGSDEFLDEPPPAGEVVGRRLFYNNSIFDGNDPAANAADDNAIAIDKAALEAGQSATFANFSSYVQGINGVMIDIDGLPSGTVLNPATDFAFATGNDDTPSDWTALGVMPSVTIRPAAGELGSDRVVLTWPDGTIRNTWLEIRVNASSNTGLPTDDVFYFGNAVGDATGDGRTNGSDYQGVRANRTTFLNPAAIDNAYDFNRDGQVNGVDLVIARDFSTNANTALNLIEPAESPIAAKTQPIEPLMLESKSKPKQSSDLDRDLVDLAFLQWMEQEPRDAEQVEALLASMHE